MCDRAKLTADWTLLETATTQGLAAQKLTDPPPFTALARKALCEPAIPSSRSVIHPGTVDQLLARCPKLSSSFKLSLSISPRATPLITHLDCAFTLFNTHARLIYALPSLGTLQFTRRR